MNLYLLGGDKEDKMDFKNALRTVALTAVAVLIAFKVKELFDMARTVPPQKVQGS